MKQSEDNLIASPELWLLFLLLGLPQFSENIYSPALPSIAHALQTTHALTQWTLSIYFIGFAVGVLSWGRLSDTYGRRKCMLMGLFTYCIGSLLCLCAHDILWLLSSRLVQGFGGSACSVMGQAIARESLSEHKRHQFFSSTGFVLAFSITLGPFVGGYLAQWFHWQSNFVFLMSLGCVLFFLAFRRLPETSRGTEKNQARLLPVLKKLACDKRVLCCMFLVGVLNGVLFSYYAEAPFIFIKILKLSASQFGRLGMFIALAALMGSMFSRKLSKYFSQNTIILMGGSIMLISSLIMLLLIGYGLVNPHHMIISIVVIILPMMGLIFANYGFIAPIALGTALLDYKNTLGTAGALFGLSYYLLISGFTWLMGFLNNGTVIRMPMYFVGLSTFAFIVICIFVRLE